jgi:hypothetical protein
MLSPHAKHVCGKVYFFGGPEKAALQGLSIYYPTVFVVGGSGKVAPNCKTFDLLH